MARHEPQFTICPNCGSKLPDSDLGTPPDYCPMCGRATGMELLDDGDIAEELDFDKIDINDIEIHYET